MGINIFQRPVGNHQLRGRLLPHLRHARNVVRRIPHQRFQVDKLDRIDLICRLHILRVVILHLRSAALGLGNADANVIRRHLQKIPVTRHESDLHPLPLRALRKGSQNVVRLQARLLHHADPHGKKQFLHHRHLFPQFRGHRFSRTLVLLVDLVPEGGRMDVKSHRQVVRLFLLQNLKHDI